LRAFISPQEILQCAAHLWLSGTGLVEKRRSLGDLQFADTGE
jgi:hypothetical protein